MKGQSGWADMSESAQLVPSDRASGDRFGYSVSIDGDNIATGALFNANANGQSGSAYVFQKPQAGWSGSVAESVRILAPNTVIDTSGGAAFFGFSVDILGTSVAVGAPRDDARGNNYGNIWIYQFNRNFF